MKALAALLAATAALVGACGGSNADEAPKPAPDFHSSVRTLRVETVTTGDAEYRCIVLNEGYGGGLWCERTREGR